MGGEGALISTTNIKVKVTNTANCSAIFSVKTVVYAVAVLVDVRPYLSGFIYTSQQQGTNRLYPASVFWKLQTRSCTKHYHCC